MRLRRVHEKWMAQIDRSRVTGRGYLGTVAALVESIGCQVAKRASLGAGRRQDPGNLEMRAHTNSRRRVIWSDIGEEKQHQQRATL
jgi:hypothetical protein